MSAIVVILDFYEDRVTRAKRKLRQRTEAALQGGMKLYLPVM